MSPIKKSRNTLAHPVLVWTLTALALAASILICTVPLEFYQQLLFALFSLGFSLLIRPEPDDKSRYRRIVLIAISCIATGRYMYWRIFESMGWFGSNLDLSAADYFFSFGLLAAEMYAWAVLYLGYFQTIWPLKRKVAPLPADRSSWPTVDVLIPTYNEPLSVVAPSILAARNLDWPSNKINVYVLDDGCREEFRQFALDVGVQYIERESSEDAKAGNINHALARTQGELVAIFDCDHSPVRSFLTKTVGWFMRSPNLGLLQTPHLFFSPDPVERNLEVFRSVPNEGQLFYGLVQDGNDLWNSTFFCGSCAVMRREALDEIGGIATDTVTEDAHTSLLMHKSAWDSAYLNLPLAAGLATEKLSAHVGQRIRWARGMVQIFRMDNPFLARGLTLSQRLSYFNAMFHFFFSLPRIIFLTAPLAFLLLEAHVIQAAAAMIAVYALPHIIQSHITNTALQGKYRHSFWAEVYETILATHIFWPTVRTLFNPRQGTFNVTDKGGVIQKDYFDWDTAMPLFFILLLNVAGFIVGIGRLLWWNVQESDTVIMTLCWTGYNMVILGAALAVARERKQLRKTVRIPRNERVELVTPDGRSIAGHTTDLSIVNASLVLDASPRLAVGDSAEIRLYDGNRYFTFPCEISSTQGHHAGISFTDLKAGHLAKLVYFTHSQDHAWDDWYGTCNNSRTLKSFFEVVRYGFRGLLRTLFGDRSLPQADRGLHRVSGWLLLIAVVTYGVLFAPKSAHAAATEVDQASLLHHQRSITFRDMGADTPIALSGIRPDWGLSFRLRRDEVVEKADLRIQYSVPTELGYDFSSLDVRLNGQLLQSMVIDQQSDLEQYQLELSINPLLVGEHNQLSLHLVPRTTEDACRNPVSALVNNLSQLDLATRQLTLADDLSVLPLPFLDTFSKQPQNIHFVNASSGVPSADTMQAMSLVASWLGAQSFQQRLSFSFSSGVPPASHAVMFVTTAQRSMTGLPDTLPQGASISLMNNPAAQGMKLLVVSGDDDQQLKQAALALASGQLSLSGPSLDNLPPVQLKSRALYDAPRWLNTDDRSYFRSLATPEALQVKGYGPAPVQLQFRLPPDLFSWQGEGLPITLHSRVSSANLDHESSLDVNLNGNPVKRINALPSSEEPLSSARISEVLSRPANQLLGSSSHGLSGTYHLFADMQHTSRNNHLQIYFNLHPDRNRADYCQLLANNDVIGRIDGNSSIDLSRFHHYARMPDLSLFVSHGFPFTRRADLSDTVVVVPREASHADIQALLTLMAQLSEYTGVAATGVSIYSTEQIGDLNDKDVLLLGTARNQPLFTRWAKHMPIAPTDDLSQWQVRNLSLFEKLSAWRNVNEKQEKLQTVERLLAANTENMEGIIGFRSPHNRHRSVVALASSTPFGLSHVASTLSDPKQNHSIRGDLALLQQDGIKTYDIAPGYFVGRLPLWSGLRWQLSNNMFYLLSLFVVTVFIGASLTFLIMKDRAHRRLHSEPHAH